jgi:hypothetical protein
VLPAAGLPNPSDPSLIAFGAAIGAFLGSAFARWNGYDRDDRTHAAIDGSYQGTAMALFVYIFVNGLAILGS